MKNDIIKWMLVLLATSCKCMKSRDRLPNIILILTDDQDVMLGSMSVMNKTKEYLGKNGANFINAFVTTPLCCPSRSSILTGMYEHNTGVFDNQETCVSKEWIEGPETRNFGAYLQKSKYRTGYFGKYLNRYNGSHIPEGWREWVAQLQNSRYYNYSINRNGQIHRHGYDYYRDYFPDLITNDSLTFFHLSKKNYPNLPVAMVLSYPGPHGPEDGAPMYQHLFEGNHLHRTPTWNYMENSDKHWIIQVMEEMSDLEIAFTDALQRKRLITLMSVDDAIQRLCQKLESLGELDNTYIIFTSDHGYHLGQFGLVKGKSMPYDFDIRVPFYIRGPGIPAGIEVPNTVLSIDIAPTILDMAGVLIPEHMDGVSILNLFTHSKINLKGPNGKKRKVFRYVGSKPWRDTFLVERSRTDEELEKYYNKTSKLHGGQLSKEDKLREECEKIEYVSPCKPKQAKECILLADGSYQIRKCRHRQLLPVKNENPNKCECPNQKKNGRMNKEEKKQQRNFLKQHVNKENIRLGRFLESDESPYRTPVVVNDDANIYQADSSLLNHVVVDPKCQVFPNYTVYCIPDVFSSRKALQEHKAFLQKQIDNVQMQLQYLRLIKNFLQDKNVIESQEQKCVCPKSKDEMENKYGEERQTRGRRKNKQDPQEKKQTRIEARKVSKKKNRRERKKELVCNKPYMNCWQHDKDHWKTPPYWTDEKVCGCSQSNNNTYWCLRTVNKTHDFLYCEFITQFVEYFDHRNDPHQMYNLAQELSTETRRQLHEQLAEMKTCVGNKNCIEKSFIYHKKPKASSKKQRRGRAS
ncbi:putative extracellular sulfatase Sulf-1 homolog isoform X2 [Anneissia japonica]|uniref:putative extracellular sulfatase Sulf-1 homolog isoform X2 n=1 Tax=Anneissia japonica TaxID=1529436 RepID=UPI001425A0BD|nr:putative extracellular sulfatase Sulf-1 homolog isoform X2 [Anneissia japonica]